MCSFHDANIRITSLISGILFKLAVQVDFSQRYGQQAFIWVEQISVRHGLNTVRANNKIRDLPLSFVHGRVMTSTARPVLRRSVQRLFSNASSIRLSW